MSKLFFDAFQNLKLNSNLQSLLEEVEITKMSSNSKRDFIRIYLNSTRLIEKRDIYSIEEEIKKQLFPNTAITIKIIESFQLSEQYTPSKLMKAYRESILEELKEYSMLEYNLFLMANYEFEEEKLLKLKLENSVVSISKADELVRILDKIFNDRCGFKIIVNVEYEEPKVSKARKMSEKKIEQEIALIVSQSSIVQTNNNEGIETYDSNERKEEREEDKKIQKSDQKQREKKTFTDKKNYNKNGKGQKKKSEKPEVTKGRENDQEETSTEMT
ncbi:hypothetical protein CG709_00895, partial [Lachnotalea glycerini]